MLSGKQNIFFSIIPALIISLLFVTPFMVSDEIYNGVIMAKEFWFFGVVALMLLFSAIQILIKKGKLRIEFNLVDILLLTFYTWCFIRAIFTPYTPFWHNHKLQILTGMMVVYFFVKNAIRNEENENNKIINEPRNNSFINKPSFILLFLIFSFILSGFLQAIYGLLQLYGIYPSYNSYFKITGSFFNPAPYAMYLAVVFPVALGQMLMKNEKIKIEGIKKYSFIFSSLNSFTQKYLPIATVVAIILVLPATMNRASWLGALAGSLAILQYKYNWLQQIKNWLNTRTKKIIGITFAVLLVCGIGLSLFVMKAGSSNGRLFIWEVTLGKIAEKPLFGHGLGRFEAEYNNWQTEYFMKHPEEMDGPKGWVAGNTKYAFNEFLELGSEIGVLGMLFFLAFFTTILFDSLKSVNTGGFHACVYFFSCSLISCCFIGFVSFPFYSLSTYIIFFVLTGANSIHNQQHVITWVQNRLVSIIMSVSAIAFAAFPLRLLQKLPIYEVWNYSTFLYKIENYAEANNHYLQCLSRVPYEGALWQHYGKSLQMAGQNKKALGILSKAKHLTADQVLYVILGDACKGEKIYTAAEKNYIYASYMQPNKLFPQYLLANLYAEMGNRQKAINKAHEVLNKNSKAESFATEEIRKKMNEMITEVSKP